MVLPVATSGLTLNPKKMKNKKAMPGVDIDRFLDCSLNPANDESQPIKFRIESIADVRPSRVEMMSTFDIVVSQGTIYINYQLGTGKII